MHGRVTEFDGLRGLGTITADDGCVYPFHCTQITDGSRQIDVGQVVRFGLLPKLGRYEAAAIDKLGTSDRPGAIDTPRTIDELGAETG